MTGGPDALLDFAATLGPACNRAATNAWSKADSGACRRFSSRRNRTQSVVFMLPLAYARAPASARSRSSALRFVKEALAVKHRKDQSDRCAYFGERRVA